MLNLQRQHLLSNEEIKQPARPRIVIEKMADINETDLAKPEGYLQRKKSDVRENGENDDDDDVVMDNKKSPRYNDDGAPEGLINGSKSPSTPRKLDDTSRSASRPETATEDKVEKMDDKQDIPSRPISANIDDTTTLISQNRPSEDASAVNIDKEDKKEEQLAGRPPSRNEINVASISEEIEKPGSPYNNDALGNVEQSLKTPTKSSDNSRSVTPSYLDTPQNAEQDGNSDKSRSSTPAQLEPPGNAEEESKIPVKSPDKSRSSTPASQSAPSPNAEREPEIAAKTPNISRSSTPQTGIESRNDEVSAEPEKPSENPNRDKSVEDTLQVKESSRPASSLSLTSEKSGKSPKSPRSPTTPRNRDKLLGSASPRSPEGVKGFDNGQQRTLSASGSPRPNSPKSPADSGRQTEDGKKKTSFVGDSVIAEKAMEMANRTSAVISKPTTLATKTPRAQTPVKADDEKAEKKAAEKKGPCALARRMNKTKPILIRLLRKYQFTCICSFFKDSEELFLFLQEFNIIR